jgi:hypothetical protein
MVGHLQYVIFNICYHIHMKGATYLNVVY